MGLIPKKTYVEWLFFDRIYRIIRICLLGMY
jgi:hypothetical protein